RCADRVRDWRTARPKGPATGSGRGPGAGRGVVVSIRNRCEQSVSNHAARQGGRPIRRSPETNDDLHVWQVIRVARGGGEPPTFRFSVGRSYQLSYLARCGPDGT